MTAKISDYDWVVTLGEVLVGTQLSVRAGMERAGVRKSVDEEDVVAYLAEFADVELCPGCGWWAESWELVDEDDNPCFCITCGGMPNV